MTGQRVILAVDDRSLGGAACEKLEALAARPDVLVCHNGATCLREYAALLETGGKASLVLLDLEQVTLGKFPTARAIRAVERGWGLDAPAPIVFYTEQEVDEPFKAVLSEVGRAVHLQKTAAAGTDEQARLIAVAGERLLSQVGGA